MSNGSAFKDYKINLRGVDISLYQKNAIVVQGWDHSLESVLGKARILGGKRSVRVEYKNGVPAFPHALIAATMVLDPSRPGHTTLMNLAVIHASKPTLTRTL